MARTRSPTHELQREAILRSAARLFAEQGFHKASMSDLARACGVSKPLLYHYHRDKEHILFDIVDSYMDQLQAIVTEVEGEGLEAEPRLQRLIERFMVAYEDSRDQHRVLVQDVKFLQDEQREQVIAKERRVVGAFAATIEALQPGVGGRGLAKAVTMILFGMINWTFTWLRKDGELSYRDMAPVVAGIFIEGVKASLGEPRMHSTPPIRRTAG